MFDILLAILTVTAVGTLFAIGAEAWTRMLMNVEALRTKEMLDDTIDELADASMQAFIKIAKQNEIKKTTASLRKRRTKNNS